jgi:23S rRNA pseudouridine2604 synthase
MFEITLLITSITKRIFPIGRLDKASEGLIFMTNDGDIVNKILRARNNHEKNIR